MGHQPAVGGVGQFQAAAHALHGFFDDGQAQAGAGSGGARGVAPKERRGQLRQLLRPDAGAVVAHAQDHPGTGFLRRDHHFSQTRVGATAVAAGVFEEVQEDPAEFGFVGHHGQIGRHFRGDLDLRRVAEHGGFAVYQRRHVHRPHLGFAGPRVVHELVDDGVELVDVQSHIGLGFFVGHAHLGFQAQPGQRCAQVVADAGQHHGAVFFHARQFAGHAVEAHVDLADLAGQRVLVQA